jgi:ATP-dependent helicase/nuclease subunit A
VKLTKVQREAAESLDRDCCLTSGAGCGKTTVLTARFMNALAASGDVQVSDLVAITFTEKAARQMRDRIRRACRERLHKARAPDQRRLWNQRLRDLDNARISTIHSFCGGLLRRCAVEAAVDPQFAILEQLDAEPLLDAAVDDVLRRRLTDEQDADIRLLLSHYDLWRLRQDVAHLAAEKRDWIANYIGATAPSAAELLNRWREGTRRALMDILRSMTADGPLAEALPTLRAHCAKDDSDKLEAIRRQALDAAEAVEGGNVDEAVRRFAVLAGVRSAKVGVKRHWDADALDAVRAAAGSALGAVKACKDLLEPPGEIPPEAAEVAVALLGLLQDVTQQYAKAKRARQVLDFKDLELGALELLERHETVRDEVARSCRHLLIDEFQDTSWLQVRLAERICGTDRSARPPRLFIVGDAKQSIYRFRDAEIEQFDRFAATFPEPDRKDLAESFRCHPAMAEFLNHLCERLGGRLTSRLKAHRHAAPDTPCVELLSVNYGPKSDADAATRRATEAAAVARRLRVMIDGQTPCVWDAKRKKWRGPQCRDVAMLFRASRDIGMYEDALLAEGIPYYTVAGSGFYGQAEIVDLRNLLTVLTEPADEVALLGVLRSPIFSITDETLYWLCRRPRDRPGQLRQFLAAAGDLAGPTAQQRAQLVFAAETLAHLEGLVDRVPVASLLADALQRTGYEAASMALFDGRRRVANIGRLLEQARRFDRNTDGGLAEFTQQIVDLIENERREEQAPTHGEADDVVRLMTIHAAKGLEFPIVVLPDLSRKPGRGQDRIARLQTELGLTVKLRDETDELTGTLPYRLAKHVAQQGEQDECLRLLYVAATRAQDVLILAGTAPPPPNSWLALLDERLELQLATRECDCDLPYGQNGRAARLRMVPPFEPPRTGRPRRRPKLFKDGILQADRLSRFLTGADVKTVADVLDACRAPPSPDRRTFGAKELALAFAGRPPIVRGGRTLFTGETDAALSPAARGLVLHRALQDYTWSGPHEAEDLVRQAAAAMDVVGGSAVDTLTTELREQLERLAGLDLHATIGSAARREAEVQFLLTLGDAQVRGVIDLLYQDEKGAWWVLDYKSDRVPAERVEATAENYRLQIELYALAAARHTGTAPVGAVLYFLAPAVCYRTTLSAGDLEIAEEHAVTTVRQIRRAERQGRSA